MAATTVYATAAEYRERQGGTSDSDDTMITALLTAASRQIDLFCNRREYGFVATGTPTAQEFAGTGQRWIFIPECVSISQVRYKDSVLEDSWTTLSSGNYRGFRGDPTSSIVNYNKTPYMGVILVPTGSKVYFADGRYASRPGFDPIDDSMEAAYFPTVEVTADWGYASSTPEIVREATIAQSAIWLKRGESAWASIISTPMGDEREYRRALDPAIEFMLVSSGLRLPSLVNRGG